MKTRYTYLARLEEDKTSGGYTVTFPDLRGCISHVDNSDDATPEYLEKMMKDYLKDILNDGEQAPNARSELVTCLPKGRLELMVTTEVTHRRLK